MTTAYAIDVIPTGVYSALNGRMETFKNIQGCFAKIKTVSGRAYRVRTSLNLTQPWSSTASYYYGYGNDITLQIGPPDNITANSPILNPLPHYEFQVASMDSTKSLVSWTSRAADNTLTTYQAVVNLNFTNCPPLSVFLTPPVAPAVTPAYGLSLVSFGLPIKPTPVGGTDPYASLTVAALPAEQQTYLAKLTGNYSALAAQWANPPATPPSIVSGAGVVQGEKQFFQIQEILVDSDGDGLTDDDELAASLNPYDKDTDGDGSPDGEEVLAASDPRDAAQKAYDPSYPAVAHWHVAPISFYYKKLNKDILYETFKGSATTFEAYAASLADGSADAPFLTITAAINAATSGARKGDVIEVAPGTYAESFVIPTNQRVILTARRGSRETTILTAPAGANPNPLISFTSGSSSLVNGFTIQGTSGTALRATSTARSTIANCLISDTGLGLSAEDLSKVVIANSVFAAPRTPLVSGFALTAKGAADVRIAHATFTHAATAAQPQIKGQDIATISLVNSLVWGPNVDVQTGQPAAQTEPPVPSAFPATVDKRETPLLERFK